LLHLALIEVAHRLRLVAHPALVLRLAVLALPMLRLPVLRRVVLAALTGLSAGLVTFVRHSRFPFKNTQSSSMMIVPKVTKRVARMFLRLFLKKSCPRIFKWQRIIVPSKTGRQVILICHGSADDCDLLHKLILMI
jgi:hypothetical protein